MIADMHVHSTFSPDGISTMEEQCIAALEKGERIICFTDHVDYNVAEKNNGIIKDNSKAVSAGRKSPFGDADKILDQIRLQEVPHVHL